MAETLIKNFKQISKTDTKIAGGKGASLGEMTQAGIPVPDGFVIISNAFDRFIEETDLNVEIDAVLDSVNIKEVHTVENASEKIQAIILSKVIPDDIKTEILKIYKELDCKFVAVRSSATSEDSASAAWAGQLDSFLNTSEETLLENVKKCWASLFTPRAIFYRFEKKLNKNKISVAVVVQKMVDSQESGIAFSVHPVTQDKNQIIIEAGFGLGEAIVSGSITPDSYVIDKQGFSILDIHVNEQTKALYKKSKDGNEWKELGEKGKKQVLTENEIIELSKLIVKIEDHYGFPCDIEWAKENGKFYIVQSRPITTLSPSKILTTSLADRFISELSGQELFPPMHSSTLFVQTSKWNVEKYYGEHYTDKTAFPLLITTKEHEGIMYIPAMKAKKLSEEVFKSFWNNESTLTTRLKKYKKQTQIIDNIYNKIISRNFVERESFSNLVNLAESIKSASWEMNTIAFFSVYFDKDMCVRLLKDLNSEVNQKRIAVIWEKGTTPVSESFEKRREQYLIYLIENGLTWEDISLKCQYFGANYNKISDPAEIEKELKNKFAWLENAEKRKKYIVKEEAEKNKRNSEFNKWLNSLTQNENKLVRYLQMIIELRDARKDYLAKFLVVVFKIAQKLFREVGVDEKLIYFYMFDEITRGKKHLLENKDDLVKRLNGCTVLVSYNGMIKIEYGTFETIKSKLDKFFLKQQADSDDDEIIKGQVGSPGNIKGKVKVVMNFSKESQKFNKGDILVTGMTRPEFIPLMKKSAAVVTDEGGITCHAAIVSRELGIPCVIGTKIGTRILKDGDLIEVDANQGIVRILKEKKQ